MTHSEDRFEPLDTVDANAMFELQAQIIQQHDINSVLDIGCRQARPLEWLDPDITYHGFDIVPEVSDRLKDKYQVTKYPNTEWKEGDWHDPPFNGHYDCLIFGGMFYYNKDTVVEIINTYIARYNPKLILICDIDYDSPAHWWPADFNELKSTFYHKEHKVQLPDSFYGMNKRVIFEIDFEQTGKLRDTLLPVDPTYTGLQAPSYPVEEMLEWIYVANTEPLDNISKTMRKEFVLDYWIGVAAGFKPYYTLCKFGFTTDTRIIYADISPREIDWRKHFDQHYTPDMTDAELTDLYTQYQAANPACEFIRGDINLIGATIRQEREFLDITDSDWETMWTTYQKAEKIYKVVNIIDELDTVLKMVRKDTVDNPTNAYLWTSNAWDWHQFRYKEAEYDAWRARVNNHIGSFYYDGKVPPFSSMQ